jgi:TolA-binding protein
MRGVDIHPEELIDKLHEGSLTPAERERLNAHLDQCSACRFEIAVRADLVLDVPTIDERPQLTFPGSAARERALSLEAPAPVKPALRRRSRRRWPLALLAAALVLSAGGAMAAVFTGAVGAHWLGFSPQPKPAESNARVAAVKPALKPKRAIIAPRPVDADRIEPASATPAVSAPADSNGIPSPVAVISPSVHAAAHPRSSNVTSTAPVGGRPASLGAFPAPGASTNSVDGSTPRVDAASLFADANRARRDGNWDRALGLYRALQSRYPNSSECEVSRALLAQMLLDRGNPEAALAGFDRYLAADTPVLSAEALVGRARALEQLGKVTQAAAAWRQVQSRFPGSVHASLAATRLAALGMR